MGNNTKYALSRWLIFISFLTAISGVFYTEVAVEIFPNFKSIDTHSTAMDIIGLILCYLRNRLISRFKGVRSSIVIQASYPLTFCLSIKVHFAALLISYNIINNICELETTPLTLKTKNTGSVLAFRYSGPTQSRPEHPLNSQYPIRPAHIP